ncbi:Hypothetical_protein [Hexamita inflata]|uniref:Hypothetical_protein n=1 Tax=Hexamita inflata TaxID=28002 RepID=A0AA86QXR3_9EUKA|nr:Hypothetical protein HINF_LOCUS50347 [Hexamita inflata]
MNIPYISCIDQNGSSPTEKQNKSYSEISEGIINTSQQLQRMSTDNFTILTNPFNSDIEFSDFSQDELSEIILHRESFSFDISQAPVSLDQIDDSYYQRKYQAALDIIQRIEKF